MSSARLIILVILIGVSLPIETAATEIPTRFPAAERIVAIGDLHGDIDATRRALRLAGAIDQDDHWCGGSLVLVQTGDQLDRGDHEQEILDLFDRLTDEAAAAGGAVHVLNGNHETMNVALDLRYVTEGGFADFVDAVTIGEPDSLLAGFDPSQQARVAAFRPGGKYAGLMAERNTVVIIGSTLFVHGGVEPTHVAYGLERLNAEVRAWMRGEAGVPEGIQQRGSVVWSRAFSSEVDDDDCKVLEQVLTDLDVQRIVVGHTVQEEGINSFCGRRSWCIDVGASAHYGGDLSILEIIGDEVRVIVERP